MLNSLRNLNRTLGLTGSFVKNDNCDKTDKNCYTCLKIAQY